MELLKKNKRDELLKKKAMDWKSLLNLSELFALQ